MSAAIGFRSTEADAANPVEQLSSIVPQLNVEQLSQLLQTSTLTE